MFDYHVHSHFSGDCQEPLEVVLATAHAKGFKEICITDHVDYDYTPGGLIFDFDAKIHAEAFQEAARRWDGKLQVKRGIEIGLQPHVLERCTQLITSESFDFVLASVHASEGKDLYEGDFYENRSPEESYLAYLEDLYRMLQTYTAYDIIGHIDLPKRYNQAVAALPLKPFLDTYEKLFAHIIQAGKGIEINTSGYRQSVGRAFPEDELVTMYYEMGGRMLTLGSDSHTATTLGYQFPEVMKRLKYVGFKQVMGFERRTPYEIKI